MFTIQAGRRAGLEMATQIQIGVQAGDLLGVAVKRQGCGGDGLRLSGARWPATSGGDRRWD